MKKRPSFEKRAKERKRQQRKQDKERKRQERKSDTNDDRDASGIDPDLAEAMAVAQAAAEGKVDEFGNVIDPDAEEEEGEQGDEEAAQAEQRPE